MTSPNANIKYLLSLPAVRDRAQLVFQAAQQNRLHHFDYHPNQLPATAAYVMDLIARDFGPDQYHLIPPHGRWQHFNVGGIDRITPLLAQWQQQGHSAIEQVRSLVDLFFVSVLLDAGAGDRWRYQEETSGAVYSRSEGIALASLRMFQSGAFANEGSDRKDVVHGLALSSITAETVRAGFQVDDDKNPLVGVAARTEILQRLGKSFLNLKKIYGELGRPGNLADHLLADNKSQSIDYAELWNVLQQTLIPIWPSDRTQVHGHPIGDAWPLRVLADSTPSDHPDPPTASIQPFHKLTQWLAYSLRVPFERLLSINWTNADLGTGLPEYRNGGLFVDMGVITLKPEALKKGLQISGGSLPCFDAGGDEIVEWRAMTVALLDELHRLIRASGRFGSVQLSLPQVLEAGSWKAGRELAAQRRPETKSSPILNSGDGTLF